MAQTLQFDVKGMTCDHCVRSVTGAVEGVAGVKAVKVDLASNSAKVDGDGIDIAKVIAAIAEEGYEATVKA